MNDQQRALLDAGLSYLAAGLSIIPIDGATKRPHWRLLPQACAWPREKDEDGNPSNRVKGIWQTFVHVRATEKELRIWIDAGAQLALVGGAISGGLLIIDVDEPRFYDAWREAVDALADDLPLQRTGGGGYQILMRCADDAFWYGPDGRERGNEKLAWVPDETKRDGRAIAIETRAARGYAIIAPSLHPSGNHYQMLSGDVTAIPVIGRAHAAALLDAAIALDEAPFTRDQLAKAAAATVKTDRYRAQMNGQGSVIDLFNERVEIVDELRRVGYVRRGSRLHLPGNGDPLRPGVVLLDEERTSFHHDSEDPLSDGHTHTAFDVFCHFDHQGDCKEAVKAAAERLGIQRERPEPTFDADGFACCPGCGKRLRQATNGNGWRCLHGDELGFWWQGEGYTPPPAEQKADAPKAEPATATQMTRSSMMIDALTRLGYSFALNLCADVVEVNGEPINDIVAAQIRTQMRDLDIKPIAAVEDAYVTEAARNAYHPIKDYLNGLVWDGKDHIGDLARRLSSDDPPVRYPGGAVTPLVEVYVRRWLVGAVAKALDQVQNVMLVLAGSQGIGKSELVRWLCSDIPRYYIEAPINVSDKDSDVRLMTRFIWEVSELDATTRKADVAALKDFITRGTVTVRRAYGRHDTVKPSLASMIGTVNEGSGFLIDDTGNRRFMVVSVRKIDWSYRELTVGQVWAHAVALYRQGEPTRLSPIETDQQSQQNKNYEVESLLEGWIQQHFDLAAGPQAQMTSAEIADHLRSKEIRLSGNPRADAMEISRVLSRLGIKKVRTSAWRGYSGIAPWSDNQ